LEAEPLHVLAEGAAKVAAQGHGDAQVDDRLAQAIRERGGEPEEVIAYRTSPARESLARAREMLLSDRIDVITFTSSATVTNLLAALDGKFSLNGRPRIASIGPKPLVRA